MNLFVGQLLIANNSCIMKDDGDAALTIGKEYPIISIDERDDEIMVIDDQGEKHYFPIDELEEFFIY